MSETLPVLYRDAALIAVHKPSGLLVHRSMLDRHETRFALQIVRDQIGQRVYPTHRLDRGTSGVLLFALDPATAATVGSAFETQRIDKTYLAVVRGHPPETGCIDHALTRQYDDYEFRADTPDTPPQEAITHYRRLGVVELPVAVDRYPTSRYALLELKPETGRRHQIRRHLKHIAHPIIGDATYGKGRHNRFFAERFDCRRLLLACTEMRLQHPQTGARLTLSAPLADDFAGLVDALGWTLTAERDTMPRTTPAH
ncbi:tRNA pseudouridine(65) synthase TruC [uncultured Propionivibrio sp.]|uniref:tRNA pseudouridine(65) synthase TruC n=1 Tax=uncultured Propionivibrio sp. TaxID=426737 RepID=UPI0029C03CB5|nr:tRNA pseudouridine(65) synthase TruC [uncultured Propionivibrio sp.]